SLSSLEAVARAAAIQPSPELRNEAIAALALNDLRFVPIWTNPFSSLVARFSPSLASFALASSAGSVKLFDSKDGREKSQLPAIGSTAARFSYSSDERFLAVSYASGSNIVWDLWTQTQLMSWGPGEVPAEFTPESQRVLVADNSGVLRCVSLRTSQ